MQKCLFLICPTDCLEQVINRQFNNENYFYTSLGNSFLYDEKTINSICNTIKKHKINDICFVLSVDNKIVQEALLDNKFSDRTLLNNYYDDIKIQALHSNTSFQNDKYQFSIISYYLNKKIKELELQLTVRLMRYTSQSVNVSGKIYNKMEDVFMAIYSDFVCIEKYQYN